ncbi:MAG: PBP1A family penicillin-binding protein [Thermoanaerobaculia bacterium]
MAKVRKQRSRAAKKTRSRRRWRRPLLILLAVSAVGIVWVAWPFWKLAGQFGAQPSKQPSRLYGQPFEMRAGAPLTPVILVRELEDMGYTLEESDELIPGTFHATGTEVEVFRRSFPTAAGPDGGDRLRIGFSDGTVASIQSDGSSVPAAVLDPPLIASYYGPDLRERRPVGLDELPEDLILSVLAAEDAEFLEHTGLSFKSILRAAWVNLWAQEVRQGGSTLTQQLVKNLYLTHERRLVRKLREAVLAVMIELRFEKRQILQAYLNEIYWGRSGSVNLMGVGAAAWAYFGKDPGSLTLAESALLAGMIQSPSHLSPLHHPEAAGKRRDAVLGRLVQLRWVTHERAEGASKEPVRVTQEPLIARRAPYFTDAVEQEAKQRFGIESLRDAGYVLHSTLRLDNQRQAEGAVDWGLEALEDGWEKGRKTAAPLQAALISVDPRSGGILAYVGGRDYGTSQFDRVTQARRQAGSAFKPVVYAAAFERHLVHPASLIEDAPLTVQLAGQRWSPQNSDGKYRGLVSVRAALEQSLNVPTARLANRIGLERIVDLAHRLGIRGHLDPFPALALGAMEVTPIELATVYATLAAGGRRPTLHGLVAVYDREDQVVAGQPVPPGTPVLDEDVAFLITHLLQGVLDRGTGRGARTQGLEDALAGKTGTTNDRRDSWFAGYSPDRASLVWVGYDDNQKTRLSGARAALPIWARFVYEVRPADGYPAFVRTPGVVAAWIDPTTGGLATTRCPAVQGELFLRDFAPHQICPSHRRGRPLEQPEGLEVEKKRHPFKDWLRMLGKKNETRARPTPVTATPTAAPPGRRSGRSPSTANRP